MVSSLETQKQSVREIRCFTLFERPFQMDHRTVLRNLQFEFRATGEEFPIQQTLLSAGAV